MTKKRRFTVLTILSCVYSFCSLWTINEIVNDLMCGISAFFIFFSFTLFILLYSSLFFISVTLLNYFLSTSDVIFNGGTLETDCNSTVGDTDLQICPILSRLADNITEEGQQFDNNSFVRFRGDFELLFQFPGSHISLVDIYFYNNPKMGYGLPPVTEAGFSFNSLITFYDIQVSFANNSHLSQSDDSVTVVSIVVSSDPFESSLLISSLVI